MVAPGLRLLLILPDAPLETDGCEWIAELSPTPTLERTDLYEGLSRLARESFDAVLIDMSNRSLDALERICSANQGPAVIALGDGDDEVLAMKTIRAGAEEFLVKADAGQDRLARVLTLAIERRRAQLARSQAQTRALLDALPDEMFRIRRDGSCFDVKPAKDPDAWSPGGSLWGGDGERTPRGEVASLFKENLETALATGEIQVFEFQHRSGSDSRLYETRLVANGAAEAVAIVRDVTESRSLEQKLGQLRRLEAMGRLAFGVAHDFNNLLTVISGNAELALSDLPEAEPSRQELEEIGDAAERAALLTRQLLAFSRRQILKPVVVDLNALVRGMEKLLRRLIGEDVELATKLERGLGAIRADPSQIEQVLMNLAINARDAMPKGGKLTFETTGVDVSEPYPGPEVEIPAGAYVMLAVSDTGVGMDADTRSRVFEPFFTTKERGKGTGLGLSTVYGIVKQSDGYIWVYSEPGMGTNFRIYFPPADSAASPAARGKSRRATETRGETILLVEDDTKVLEVAHRFLEDGGYRVISTSNIAEALAMVQDGQRPIDLLATDVVMPGMSGRDLAERLRSVRPGLRTLYISGYTDDAIAHHGVLGPGVAFLEKPYSRQDLLAAVRRALDNPD